MTIYYVNYFLNMIIGSLIFRGNPRKATRNQKKVYLILTCISLGLICGLRSIDVGYDTYSYYSIFLKSANEVGKLFDNNTYVEIGFFVLCGMIRILGGDFQILLILTSFFIVGSCCIFIYRHSENVLMSVFIILSFPYYYSSFDIIRHFIACSFFLLAYKYVESRNLKKFLIYIIIGSLFHKITFIFILFYFLYDMKFNVKFIAVSSSISLVSLLYADRIFLMLALAFGKAQDIVSSGWAGEHGGGIKTSIMYIVIFVIALILYINKKEHPKKDEQAIKHMYIMFCVSVIFLNARIMTRIIMFMVAMVSISMPTLFNKKEINSLRKYKTHLLLFMAFIAIGVFYHWFMLDVNWQNIVPYVADWR